MTARTLPHHLQVGNKMSYNFGYILYYKYNPHKILRFIEPATKLSFLSEIIASTQFAIWHSSGQFDLACERVPKKISTTDPVFKMNCSRKRGSNYHVQWDFGSTDQTSHRGSNTKMTLDLATLVQKSPSFESWYVCVIGIDFASLVYLMPSSYSEVLTKMIRFA